MFFVCFWIVFSASSLGIYERGKKVEPATMSDGDFVHLKKETNIFVSFVSSRPSPSHLRARVSCISGTSQLMMCGIWWVLMQNSSITRFLFLVRLLFFFSVCCADRTYINCRKYFNFVVSTLHRYNICRLSFLITLWWFIPALEGRPR